jgi:hypothetical protein
VYHATPALLPAAQAGRDGSVRGGFSYTLDGSKSIGDSELAYFWQQTAGPSTVEWSGHFSINPTVSRLVAGQYTFQLQVRDQAGQTGTDTVNIGVVGTTDGGRVLTGNAVVDTILGPLLAFGQSPWPWFDDRHKALADFFGNLLVTDADWSAQWNTALPGQIGVTNGSATVTGVGTTFQTHFCGGAGNTAPDESYTFVVWYLQGTTYGRANYGVSRCASQTELTLSSNYTTTSGTASGLSYARWHSYGTWIGNSTNINFYDNVLAYYALYYRTGLTIYRDYARTLADAWYTMPYVDKGLPTIKDGSINMYPRNLALSGLILRAVDGKPEYWDGLEPILDVTAARIQYTTELYDIRETGYDVAYVALGALFCPDSGKRTLYTTALQSALVNRWQPQQQPNGNWRMIAYGYDSWDAQPGTVTVTNGSSLVTGSGTNWDSGRTDGKFFWVLDDTAYYTATYNSPTQVSLDRPYAGPTASGKEWAFHGDLVGRGTQPFQMGIVATAWNWAYLALNAAGSSHTATARKFVLDAADWIADYGVSPTAKGLYYARGFLNCEPISDGNPNCGAGSVEDARYLNSEVIRAFTSAFLLTGDPKYLARGDQLFGAVWGKDGGPQSDSIYVSEYADGGWTFATKKAKNLGFGFGFGFGSGWPAARAGTPPPATGRAVSVAMDLASVPNAARVRVTLRAPDGTATEVTCSASPCTTVADERQGDDLLRLEYLSSSDKVLATSDWISVSVR